MIDLIYNTKLTIIVTCYNEEEYIKQCLESILIQTRNDLEIICIDDASSDSSLEVINQYSKLITIKHFEKNVGLSNARNYALSIAHGKYLMFVDGDDYIDPDTIDLLWPLLDQDKDVIFGLIEEFKEFEELEIRLNDPYYLNASLFDGKSAGEFLLMVQNSNIRVTPAQKYIVKRTFVTSNSLLFQDIIHEDQLWIPNMVFFAESIILFNHKFYYHRNRINSLGQRNDEKTCQSYVNTCKSILNLHSQTNDRFKKAFFNERCVYLLDKIDRIISQWNYKQKNEFLINNIDDLLFIYKNVCTNLKSLF